MCRYTGTKSRERRRDALQPRDRQSVSVAVVEQRHDLAFEKVEEPFRLGVVASDIVVDPVG